MYHDLTTCTLCLRVQRGTEWVEVERVIRQIRSYELDTVPRLNGAICDACADSIWSRRAQAEGSIAA